MFLPESFYGKRRTIFLVGPTGSGKTTQIGILAQAIHKDTGKITRVYTADRGGVVSLEPLEARGIVEIVDLESIPWSGITAASEGKVLRPNKASVPAWTVDHANVGMFAFEGMTAFCNLYALGIQKLALEGHDIGGAAKAVQTFRSEGGEHQITQLTKPNIGQIQGMITKAVNTSSHLPGIVLWTALDEMGEDEAGQRTIGARVQGRALTTATFPWFNFTFRLTVVPEFGAENHRLYLKQHIDPTSMAQGISNLRLPITLTDDGELSVPDVPEFLEPANIVKALGVCWAAHAS